MRKFLLKYYLRFKFKIRGLEVSPFLLCQRLEISQYWKREEIESEQLKRIEKLIETSRKEVKYYQDDKFKVDLPFKNIESFIEDFPFISKANIRKNPDLLLNKTINKRINHSTSGSTGERVIVGISALAESYRLANFLRFFKWWGIDFYDKSIYLWKIPERKNSLYRKLKKIEYRLMGLLEMDVFGLSDKTIHSYIDRIEKYRPVYIRGYKSGVFELARLMEKHNLRFKKSRLKLVVVTAETMFENERGFIEQILGTRVANEYGSADGGQYAFECPGGSMHINEESVHMSVDKDNNAYVTEIFNDGMPLIRYKNEDRLFFDDKLCSCGRTLRCIKTIDGRISDYVECDDGKMISSTILGIIFGKVEEKYKGSIAQFNVRQIEEDFKIYIIPGETFSNEVLEQVKMLIRKNISTKAKIEFEITDQIQRDKNGKLACFKKMIKI